MQYAQNLIHSTLKLLEIRIIRAWITKYLSLLIQLHSTKHRLFIFQTKKTLFSLPDYIFIDEDLT